MLLSLIDLIKKTEGEIIANISGGPREIFLAFAIASLAQSRKIQKATNFSDINRSMREMKLPDIVQSVDKISKIFLKDILEKQPTTITEISERLGFSESTVSRQVSKLDDISTIVVAQKGKTKHIELTLTGDVFY